MLLALKFIASVGLHKARQAEVESTGLSLSARDIKRCKRKVNCNELTHLSKVINHLRLLLRVQSFKTLSQIWQQ